MSFEQNDSSVVEDILPQKEKPNKCRQFSPSQAFALQLIEEFFVRNGFSSDIVSSMRKEVRLLDEHFQQDSAPSLWSEMYSKCQLNTVAGALGDSSSNIENILAYLQRHKLQPVRFTTGSQNTRQPAQETSGGSTSKKANTAANSSSQVRSIKQSSSNTFENTSKQSRQKKVLAKRIEKSKKTSSSTSQLEKLILEENDRKIRMYVNEAKEKDDVSRKCMITKETKAFYDRKSRMLRKEIMDTMIQEEHDSKHVAYSKMISRNKPLSKELRDCALCCLSLPIYNVQYETNFKTIMNLHDKWNYDDPSPDVAKFKAPRCYDKVFVCGFCYQLVRSLPRDEHSLLASATQKKRVTAVQDISSCSDPLSLPPLVGDECEERTQETIERELLEKLNKIINANNNGAEEELSKVSGAIGKEMVYGDLGDINHEQRMSSKEWKVIKPSWETTTLTRVLRSTLKKEDL